MPDGVFGLTKADLIQWSLEKQTMTQRADVKSLSHPIVYAKASGTSIQTLNRVVVYKQNEKQYLMALNDKPANRELKLHLGSLQFSDGGGPLFSSNAKLIAYVSMSSKKTFQQLCLITENGTNKAAINMDRNRPISALVDITNYFSVDRARPLHVYDLAKLTGAVTARRGRAGDFRRLGLWAAAYGGRCTNCGGCGGAQGIIRLKSR